ncbi:luciferase [Pseudonocardia sulfidoxydans NBRC 16205]|uniref:Luciferase n=1 Tax=Pseudonocardia sulfidoxydans NBRC 16205 TaxID=1223511 RepID=A0A511DMZ0_9PSEU|nr:LLM class flavin-dependent oxidoreductase [Pseudonocardia sulfidoxydans]GEL25633.1 luciferase [Pseudonocardia sulfidoxydans NBRC 16205]
MTTFADASPAVAPSQRLRETVEQIALADEVGLDMFGVGEHHRGDYLASAPAMVLAAGAERSSRIRLSSAVTVLSSDDPVRVFQNFATLDLLSGGRAEIMAGRGSFVESFPLFGHDLADYDALFAEKLDLLLAVRDHPRVTWSGQHRPALTDQPVYPRPVQDPLPVWVAVGGNPQSVVRAGMLGLPMALAIIGGTPDRFVPFAELFRRALGEAGHNAATPLSLNMHGFVAGTDAAASDLYYPSHSRVMNRIGRERGWSPTNRAAFDAATTLQGPYVVGSPERVAEKMLLHHELFGHDRIALQFAVGDIAHEHVMRAIELLGTEVAPLVRDEVARRRATPAAIGQH